MYDKGKIITGVVIGLLAAQSYFGFMTLLGVISLAGIVINNAIVLLERIKLEIEINGLEPARAVIEAAQRLMEHGAELAIVGCTEVPIILKSEDIPIPLLDPVQVLAECCLQLYYDKK